jgi:hypothetical protein
LLFGNIEEHLPEIPVKPIMGKPLFLLIVGLGLVAGCAHRRHADTNAVFPVSDKSVVLNEARVSEIARQAVAANDTWVDRAEFEPPKRRADGTWSVLVWRLPKVPGGHRVVVIDENGRVTAYIRGA